DRQRLRRRRSRAGAHVPAGTSEQRAMSMRIRQLPRRMRGFSLVTGIFLLVVLSALGAFMVIFTGLQQNTVQVDILGVRAYYAARAGLNWAMYQALDPDNPGSATPAACP